MARDAPDAYPPDVVAIAALTLAQEALAHLPRSGHLSRQELGAVVDTCVKLHLQSPAGELMKNRQIGGLLREIGEDLLKRG